jgi:hypothetical protein
VGSATTFLLGVGGCIGELLKLKSKASVFGAGSEKRDLGSRLKAAGKSARFAKSDKPATGTSNHVTNHMANLARRKRSVRNNPKMMKRENTAINAQRQMKRQDFLRGVATHRSASITVKSQKMAAIVISSKGEWAPSAVISLDPYIH